MAGDVNVVFSADTTQLDAAVQKVKTETQNLVPGGVGSGVLTPLPGGLGGPPRPPGGGFRVLSEEERDAARAARELADAQNNAGEAAQQHGINFGRMVERMAISLVVFGAIREAIKGIKAAMDEAISDETVTTRFRNLTTNAVSANTELAKMAETATKIGAKKEDLIGLNLALQQGGESAHNAGIETETLAGYAGVAGEKMGPLGEMMTRLRVGSGTISDMEHLVGLMGEAGNPLRAQVELYKEQEVQLRRNEEQISRNTQLQERGIEETTRLQDRAYEQQQRHNEAVTEFSDKLGIAKEVFQDIQKAQPVGLVERAGVDVTEQAEFLEKRERAGEDQIEQEEQLSLHQLRRLEGAGLINEKDLIAAAQRAQEADRLAQKNKQEDARIATRNASEDAAYTRRHTQEEESLELQGEVYAAVKARLGLEDNLAKLLETQANRQAQVAAETKKIADNSLLVKDATNEWTRTLAQASQLLAGISATYEKIKTQGAPSALTELFAGKETAQAIFSPKTTAIGIGNLFGQTGTEAQFLTPDAQRALQLLERSATANEGVHAALTAP